MTTATFKISDFLQDAKDPDHPTMEEKEQAVRLLIEAMRRRQQENHGGRLSPLKTYQPNGLMLDKNHLREINARMNHIHKSAFWLICAGQASASIH